MVQIISSAKAVASELWESGYVMFPIDQSFICSDEKNLKSFVERRLSAEDSKTWRFQLPGEDEDDVGLVHLSGKEGKDRKWFFHHNVFLQQVLKNKISNLPEEDRLFLEHTQSLFSYACGLGLEITKALDDLYDLNVHESYVRSCNQTVPYRTSTLRSLYYPNELLQSGARDHVDRDFLTIHFGDLGGKLIALGYKGNQNGLVISPPPGYAVAFFGVKVLWVTDGRKQPLWHKSITTTGEDRFASVHFGHVPISGYLVKDANVALDDFQFKYLPLINSGSYSWKY